MARIVFIHETWRFARELSYTARTTEVIHDKKCRLIRSTPNHFVVPTNEGSSLLNFFPWMTPSTNWNTFFASCVCQSLTHPSHFFNIDRFREYRYEIILRSTSERLRVNYLKVLKIFLTLKCRFTEVHENWFRPKKN